MFILKYISTPPLPPATRWFLEQVVVLNWSSMYIILVPASIHVLVPMTSPSIFILYNSLVPIKWCRGYPCHLAAAQDAPYT